MCRLSNDGRCLVESKSLLSASKLFLPSLSVLLRAVVTSIELLSGLIKEALESRCLYFCYNSLEIFCFSNFVNSSIVIFFCSSFLGRDYGTAGTNVTDDYLPKKVC
jgi:hypothetical protein